MGLGAGTVPKSMAFIRALRLGRIETDMVTRRAFLRYGMNASLAFAPYAGGFLKALPLLTLKLTDGATVNLPGNFTGLGYEMSSVAIAGLLSQTNHRYISLIKGLGPNGVIRVGGIVSDYTRYEPDGTIIADRQNTVLTRASLEQFAAFLATIGWTAIWSLNFAQGTLQDAVKEATAVSSILKSRLLAIEIGNEVENYSRGKKPFREPPYDYESYRKEYNEWRAAILRAAPRVRFAAPDTAHSVEWVERMAADAKGDVQLLTTHYYRNGQVRGSVEQLLAVDPRLEDILRRLRVASDRSGIPWRMCETNSFSGGGRPGVSDSFLGALWTLDYMLLLARSACSGVNIETGVNQLGFISSYSPIQDDGHGMNTAGVPYYGMLAFRQATIGCREILPSSLDAQGKNVTAYVLGEHGRPKALVVVNRDHRDIDLSIQGLKMRGISVLRLCSPTLENRSNVTLGGSSVDEDGNWIAKDWERVGREVVRVPRMSAAILRSE